MEETGKIVVPGREAPEAPAEAAPVPGTCSGCRAFNPQNNECRRKSPVMVPLPIPGAIAGQMEGFRTFGLYPGTRPEGWCMEYLARK